MLLQSLSGAATTFPQYLNHEEEPITLRSGVIAQGFSKGQGQNHPIGTAFLSHMGSFCV